MKYYVSFGKYKKVLIAGNPIHACIKVLRSYMDDIPLTISKVFRVSQCGFEDHDDDEIYSLKEILKTIKDSEKAKKELAKRNKKS